MGKIARKFKNAIIDDNYDSTKLLLKEHRDKIDINKVDKYGNTYLSIAISRSSIKIFKLLLEEDAKPNIVTDRGDDIVSQIIGYGYVKDRLQKLQLLLDYRVQDRFLKYSIHFAAACYNSDIVKLLIDYGLDINLQDCLGNTPLIIATLNPYGEKSAIHLIEAKANLSISNKLGINCSLGVIGYNKKRVIDLLRTKNYNCDLYNLLNQHITLKEQATDNIKTKILHEFPLYTMEIITFFSLSAEEQISILPTLNREYLFDYRGGIVTNQSLSALTSIYQANIGILLRGFFNDDRLEEEFATLDYAFTKIYYGIETPFTGEEHDNLWSQTSLFDSRWIIIRRFSQYIKYYLNIKEKINLDSLSEIIFYYLQTYG